MTLACRVTGAGARRGNAWTVRVQGENRPTVIARGTKRGDTSASSPNTERNLRNSPGNRVTTSAEKIENRYTMVLEGVE